MGEISFYIHIPFCKSKCLYCDFLSFADREKYVQTYVDALINEIKAFKTNSMVKSVFIGGGTPSVIDSKYICIIMSTVYDNFNVDKDAEITLEANPGTVNMYKLKDYVNSGINRISFGVQAWQDRLLKRIGRIHSGADAASSILMAKEAGFHNINCDIMFSLPNQSCRDFIETIERVTDLQPKHISAYSLIIEEGTPLYDMYNRGEIKPVDEYLDRKMYHRCIGLLEKKGYKQYEISNFAKEGYQCRHNLVYWYRGEYKGFGLGAASLVNEVRLKNTEDFYEYIKGNNAVEAERLSTADMQEEFMFLGLRCNSGISEKSFFYNFGISIDEIYGKQISQLISNGLIMRENGCISLTERGFDLANMVFVEFMQ